MPFAPTPSLPPQSPQLQSEDSTEWNPYVIGSLIAVCTAVLFFSYYRLLKRLCCALNALSFSRTRGQMTRLNGDIFRDPSPLDFCSLGLESGIMHSLPITQFKKARTEEPRNECAVCLGEFEDGEWIKCLPVCGHVFHAACIDTWFQTHSNCPLCRSYVCVPSHDCSVSVDTLLQTLRREDFFHESERYRILRSEILQNYAFRHEEVAAGHLAS